MKKISILTCLIAIVAVSISFTIGAENEKPQYIPASEQRTGDAIKGYDYLVNGDYIKSGVPYGYFMLLNGKDNDNVLNRPGKNANVGPGFTVVNASNGVEIVAPNCLQCHGDNFEGQFILGLGNTTIDFSNVSSANNFKNNAALKVMQTISPKQYDAAYSMIRSFNTVYPLMETEVRGVNAADRLATLLVAHRNPITLQWTDTPILQIPKEVIPTDVPAWWMLKKKNAMFYNGFGRGDFAQFMMLSNILTTSDTTEARSVSKHFGDVLAYIKSIEPPKYPEQIDETLASEGETIFINNCSGCHGTYGREETYPNLLIPMSVIQTDSMLVKANHQNPQFIDWFNKSWFAKGNNPAQLVPANGYVAPPLDGVWITAPYLHNGSVPTVEAVLNSKVRPTYWERNFNDPQYDYQKLGWVHEEKTKPIPKKTYNTKLPGYGNHGHTFGDHLSDKERKAVIEYLKTL
jgi:mono/diheme cytochrome c family protein